MKKIIALILAVLTVVSLAACGSKQVSTETTAAPAQDSTTAADATTEAAVSSEPVEVVLWHTYTDHHQENLQKIIDDFNASQDQYVVVAQQQPYSEVDGKLLQAANAGTAPDLISMFPSDAIGYISNNFLYDMTGFIDDPEIGMPTFRDEVSEGLYKEITQWGGEKIYMIPTTFGSEVLYYNATWFEELNIEVPTTWAEVEAAAKTIYEAKGIAGFGTDSITDTFQDWITQAGSSYIDVEADTLAIDKDIAIEKLNWFANGINEGYFRLVGEDFYFSNPFGSQAVGMYIGSAAGVDYARGAIPAEGEAGHFEMGVAPVPQEGPVKYIPSWPTTMVCLSKDEAHARGAYLFLKYWTSEEVNVDWAIAFGATPAYRSAIANEKFQEYAATNPAAAALIQEFDWINYLPSVLGAATVRTEIETMVNSVALGIMDAETAWAAFEANCNAALAEN